VGRVALTPGFRTLAQMPAGHLADWQPPPANFSLTPGEVTVWRLAFERSADERLLADSLLSADERARAARLVRPVDRNAFVIQRATLRLLLQRLVGQPAAQLRFVLGERGKPALDRVPGAPEFNVSGSGDWGLLAFAADFPLGVDVEAHRELDYFELGERVFAAEELEQLRTLPVVDRQSGFFAGWSRKEALIKALGLGLYFPLEQFAVSLAPGEPARVRSIRGDPALAEGWTLKNLIVAPGYSAALAAQARFSRVHLYEVPHLRKLT